MKISDSTSISLPARNLLAILAAVAIGTMSYFSVIERLNKIETTLQLMEKDLEAANTFIDSVPKGGMVSPQVQELYMLVEYLGENVDKLKEQMETIKVVFAILMIQNGATIEMVPTEGLSDCLKQKRVIARNIGEEQQGIYMQCKEVTASLYEDMGRLKIKKIYD
jgi:phosphotransacetylase